jgi:putative mycofactocin binding protein MftB
LRWTGSAVSTESSIHTIPHSVRVRKEAFGLLFYNTEDSSLTFVKSGDTLEIEALPNGTKSIVAGRESKTQIRVKKLLALLSKKRLIGGS